MGINGLLPKLASITTPIHIKQLASLRVAIDAYVWLHRGAYSCSSELCQNIPTDKYITYCMNWIRMLQQNGVIPVVVFDGGGLPTKRGKEVERRERREINKQKAVEHLLNGNTSAANDCFQKAVDITPKMAYNLIQVLQAEGIEYIVAPYEADAQLAFLSRSNYVDAVITEDSDLIPYGASRIIFKLDKHGNGFEVKAENLANNQELDLKNFTRENFRHMCILAGCDYLPSLPGLGIKTAHQYVSKYKDISKILPAIQANKNVDLPPTYQEDFKKADLTFLHQRVWDPTTKQLVTLNPLPPGLNNELSFIGPHLEHDYARQIAEGIIDPCTGEFFQTADLNADVNRDARAYIGRRQSRPTAPVIQAQQPQQQQNHILNYFSMGASLHFFTKLGPKVGEPKGPGARVLTVPFIVRSRSTSNLSKSMELPQQDQKPPEKVETRPEPIPFVPTPTTDRNIVKSLIAPATPEKFDKKVILKSRFFEDLQQPKVICDSPQKPKGLSKLGSGSFCRDRGILSNPQPILSSQEDSIEDFTQDPFLASPNYHSDLEDSPVIVINPSYTVLPVKRIAESPPNSFPDDCVMLDLTTTVQSKTIVRSPTIDLSDEISFSKSTQSPVTDRSSPANVYSEHFTNKNALNFSREPKHGLTSEPKYLSRFPTKKRDSPVRSCSSPNLEEPLGPFRSVRPDPQDSPTETLFANSKFSDEEYELIMSNLKGTSPHSGIKRQRPRPNEELARPNKLKKGQNGDPVLSPYFLKHSQAASFSSPLIRQGRISLRQSAGVVVPDSPDSQSYGGTGLERDSPTHSQ